MICRNSAIVAMTLFLFGIIPGCVHGNDEDLVTEFPDETLAFDGILTETQVNSLADRILENTPEYIHWSEGTVFSWVYLENEPQENLEALREVVLERLRAKYTVYLHEADIPEDLRNGAPEGIRGYEDGFSFSYRVEQVSEGTIKVYYADWEGMLAASMRWIRYKWTGANWKVVEKGPLLIS